MLSKVGFAHGDLLRWQDEYVGRSLNVNGTIMRDAYRTSSKIQSAIKLLITVSLPERQLKVSVCLCQYGIAVSKWNHSVSLA
ncbi:hypothetical protein EHW66_10560 [Erwinia psidii]|uniref:Uncharacterized protein n=1 Tax=Erwinia psidii TaxID=69224 RepID=A0A3N6RWK4_9GAMM|nr:hypothetical protein [Erwinia psidii]MCX8961837.1 hypothetical protein [Erwinia psidii]MCX8965431.1 hypothetical protein [Erwinia psidii]RQM37444.1 hypothetical protein EB241_14370 [Erwinia psidii]